MEEQGSVFLPEGEGSATVVELDPQSWQLEFDEGGAPYAVVFTQEGEVRADYVLTDGGTRAVFDTGSNTVYQGEYF